MEPQPPSAQLVSRGKRHERERLRRTAIKFYSKFPKLFANSVNQNLAKVVTQLKKSNERLLEENARLAETKEDLEQEMMFNCWDDHGPYILREAFAAFNRKSEGGLSCACARCVRETDRADELEVLHSICMLFELLRDVMVAHEISFVIDDPFESVHPNTGFHPNLACHFLPTVSDLDVHLVFPDPYEDPYKFYYGRKLWEVENPFDDAQIDRLRLFKNRLNYKPVIVPYEHFPSSPSAEY
jgi:hypothetical protein